MGNQFALVVLLHECPQWDVLAIASAVAEVGQIRKFHACYVVPVEGRWHKDVSVLDFSVLVWVPVLVFGKRDEVARHQRHVSFVQRELLRQVERQGDLILIHNPSAERTLLRVASSHWVPDLH